MKLIIFTGQQQLPWLPWLDAKRPNLSSTVTFLPLQEAIETLSIQTTTEINDKNTILVDCTLEQLDASIDSLSFNVDFHVFAFYSEPQQALLQALNSAVVTQRPLSLTEQINIWHNDADILLNLALSFSNNVSLINYDTNQTQPNAFVDIFSNYSELHLDIGSAATAPSDTNEIELSRYNCNNLISLISYQACVAHPTLYLLYEQLESASDLPGLEKASNSIDLEQSVADIFKQLSQKQELQTLLEEHVDKSAVQQQLMHIQLQDLEQQLEKNFNQTQQYKSELTETRQTLQAELEQLQQRFDALSHEKQTMSDENELALLQINQLQEELESTFIAAQRAQSDLADTQAQQLALQSQYDEQQLRLSTLSSAKQNLIDENELALLQINQLQEELESTFSACQQAQSGLADAQAQQLALQNQYDEQQQRLSTLSSEKQNLRDENELALLQINQLQEEIESIYLYSQQQTQELSQIRTDNDNLHQELHSQTDNESQLKLSLNEYQTRIDQLQNELSQKDTRSVQLAKAKQSLEIQFQEQTETHRALQSELSQSIDKLNNLIQEKSTWRTQQATQQDYIAQLESLLKQEQAKVENLEQQNNSLVHQLSWQVLDMSTQPVASPPSRTQPIESQITLREQPPTTPQETSKLADDDIFVPFDQQK